MNYIQCEYIVHIHVNSPRRTSETCLIALDTLQTSCCTSFHESAVLGFFAFSMASSIPGKDVDPQSLCFEGAYICRMQKYQLGPYWLAVSEPHFTQFSQSHIWLRVRHTFGLCMLYEEKKMASMENNLISNKSHFSETYQMLIPWPPRKSLSVSKCSFCHHESVIEFSHPQMIFLQY